MKRFALLACLALPVMALAQGSERSDAEVQARASALQVAGAFSNDGFKIRDSHWVGTVSPKEPKIIEVNLYAGNQYWFIAAGSGDAKRLTVSLFDENGKPVTVEPYENNEQAAAGFSPAASGPYYVRIGVESENAEGSPASVCLLYCYK